ncbi:MAG: thiamine pyrophosphate-dependent dehydrogenase E1 component subunit alpha [Alphaproteobacteria bacterium]|nr:thiamine pyrophosphate-dependent dehydrogenase E1 component subunit alpha [Alphaproteobacteria bacterium]MDX5369548.1 thiamine pyrophosphate-dependent dehydrogenase E1 component subunit alpha [Alphaproteobacteria bacterium]MDX5464206.1 thiamine pyrophosphate-dependent dehydrogenase E1 component subunit alpha [Alphaproteobacteria bacterium]
MTARTAESPGAPPNFDRQRLLDQYRMMCRIRAFEEAAVGAISDKLVLGAIHPSIGQEAVAVGVCGTLDRADILLSTHRGHGHTMAKGADPVAMMCELFGRAGGCCSGKGGSMHIADFEVGMLGANGVVGANITIAAGAAHAIKLKGEDRVVACLFGDGAINRGPFLEGLNWAQVFGLNVLFVCEDNVFSSTTRTSTMTAGPGAAARAEAIGIPAVEVDGNDVLAVEAATKELLADVRRGQPRFLVAKTYRLTGHTGVDPAPYRPAEEVQEAWTRDPIARARAMLETAGYEAGDLAAIAAAAQREMRAAYDTARAAPWPDSDLAYADVQDVGDPRMVAF